MAWLLAAWMVALPQDGEPKVEISLPRTVFDPTEVIVVSIRLINTSSSPLTLRLNLGTPGYLPVFLEDPSGAVLRPRSFAPLIEGPPLIQDLAPGEHLTGISVWSLSYLEGRGGFRPPEEGRWKLQARLSNWHSNEFEFHVRRNALLGGVRQIFGSEAWHGIVTSAGSRPEDIQRFRAFVRSRIEAPQKDIMAYFLGSHDYSHRGADGAIEMYRIALDSLSPNVPKALIARPLIDLLRVQGRFEEALDILGKLKIEPKDVERRQWEERKAELQKARQSQAQRK